VRALDLSEVLAHVLPEGDVGLRIAGLGGISPPEPVAVHFLRRPPQPVHAGRLQPLQRGGNAVQLAAPGGVASVTGGVSDDGSSVGEGVAFTRAVQEGMDGCCTGRRAPGAQPAGDSMR
jgi:hypothetical protein